MFKKSHAIPTSFLSASIFLFFVGCGGDDPAEPDNTSIPELTTSAVSEITQTTAECGGTITSDGGADVTARGVCWSIAATPTIADDTTVTGAGTGGFTSSITGLTAGTPYYVRAYAVNSEGTGYGEIRSFDTESPGGGDSTGTVTDIDGNVYQTVKVCGQWWMAENLKVTRYRNGDDIANVTGNAEWEDLVSGAYCSYDNNESNVAAYGRLYNWYAVADARDIAPEGWRVPTDDDWKQLEMCLGLSQEEADDTGWRGTDEGGQLKETGTTYWQSPNNGATNESGFSALPAGYRTSYGYFSSMGYLANFWSSVESDSERGWYRYLFNEYSGISRYDYPKSGGYSVRCVRD